MCAIKPHCGFRTTTRVVKINRCTFPSFFSQRQLHRSHLDSVSYSLLHRVAISKKSHDTLIGREREREIRTAASRKFKTFPARRSFAIARRRETTTSFCCSNKLPGSRSPFPFHQIAFDPAKFRARREGENSRSTYPTTL